jgi:hypothetical protein
MLFNSLLSTIFMLLEINIITTHMLSTMGRKYPALSPAIGGRQTTLPWLLACQAKQGRDADQPPAPNGHRLDLATAHKLVNLRSAKADRLTGFRN